VIPARFGSTRLPGKALLDIAGKPLIQRVYENAMQCRAPRTIIATDDDRIAAAGATFGAEVCMTSPDHVSGTDRIAEVATTLGLPADEIIVNVQGDEPLLPPALVVQVGETLARHDAAVMSTAMHPIEREDDYTNPNVVKVVTDAAGHALYFSRAPIPWHRDNMARGSVPAAAAQRHIGIYAYRVGFLREYTAWAPCVLEQIEALEQLRVLWHGRKIAVCEAASMPGPGVDTQADLDRVRTLFGHRATQPPGQVGY
jgi:3-deoxy-manno-octulosonate cytidylyltransferase (CMP-KDO synthetase)